jgi:heat shock protein HslJ/uncharacterized lipoprotein NlpE involved in copper resistance
MVAGAVACSLALAPVPPSSAAPTTAAISRQPSAPPETERRATGAPAQILPVPGTFAGTLPCASCPGIRVTLTLFADGTYRQRSVYLEAEDGEDRTVLRTGEWRLERSPRLLVLAGRGEDGGSYKVVSKARLRLLSNKGLPIESDLPYELDRLAVLDPLEGDPDAGAAQPTADGAASRCFGNEPSWSLELAASGEVRFTEPGKPTLEYRGSETRIAALRELVWRGARAGGGGEIVAFLSEEACSDGMSDSHHPVTARVSLPDGRFLAGCCRVPGRPGTTPTGREALEGVTWSLMSLSGLEASALEAASRRVTARFEAGRFAGFSGCNQFGGGYRVDGDQLVLGQVVATRMACPEAAMAVETAVHAALSGQLRIRREGDRLTLAPIAEGSSAATLTFQAMPPVSLEGVTWSVTSYRNEIKAMTAPVADTTLTLRFEGGTATGSSGCNTYRAGYRVEGNRIQVEPATVTETACSGAVMEQEKQFLAALQSATAWAIRGERLDLLVEAAAAVVTARTP